MQHNQLYVKRCDYLAQRMKIVRQKLPRSQPVKQISAFTELGNSLQNSCINLLQPTGYLMHQQFNIQQLYALPTLYLCVLYLSENKQRLVPLTA